MQSLSSVLKATGDIEIDYSEPENIERFLLTLGPTADFEAAVREAQRGLEETPEESSAHMGYAREFERLIILRARYIARDALAAGRPEGCFCLGLGGRRPRFTQSELKIYSETCTCPDGLRVQQAQDEIRAEENRKREAERAMRLFGRAQVPSRFAGCTLSSFPVTEASKASLARLKEWLTTPDVDADDTVWNAWIDRNKESLFLYGSYGVGKTGLAVGILRSKIADEGGGLFFTVPTLLDHIRRTYAPNPVADEHEIIQTVKNAPLLVLDDLGAERVTEWVREKLFTIINHRHDENLPTIFTSNLDIAELGQHIGERTTWRIVEMATLIHIEGPNLRNPKGA